MEELHKEEYEKKKRLEFTKRMLPSMMAIAGFMVFYLMSGGLYENSINSLMIAMVISVTIASFIAVEPEKFSYFVVRGLAVFLFFLTFSGVCFSILFYESMPFLEPSRLREAQVFLSVSSSGMMGGLMRYFSHEAVIKKEELNLWHMVHAAIVGLFVSVVLFLILRAGIINQTQIDTFNVWGVAGAVSYTHLTLPTICSV